MMNSGHKETFRIRIISIGFVLLALAVFKPFGLEAWRWEAYAHLLIIGILGIGVCMITEVILRYIVKMPRSYSQGVGYIIRRNQWFQFINTPLIALMICLYRHFVLNDSLKENQLSWSNFFETLIIIAFCSFAIGLYWRYKFRSRYLTAELEETRQLNEQLREMQQRTKQNNPPKEGATTTEPSASPQTSANLAQSPSTITLTGTTSETVTIQIPDLLYIEAVGNYMKVYQWRDGKLHTDMLRATSKQIEEDLSHYPMIVRCHRAFLINLQQVEQIVSKSGTTLLLTKHVHDSIPVSRSNMKRVKEAITRL